MLLIIPNGSLRALRFLIDSCSRQARGIAFLFSPNCARGVLPDAEMWAAVLHTPEQAGRHWTFCANIDADVEANIFDVSDSLLCNPSHEFCSLDWSDEFADEKQSTACRLRLRRVHDGRVCTVLLTADVNHGVDIDFIYDIDAQQHQKHNHGPPLLLPLIVHGVDLHALPVTSHLERLGALVGGTPFTPPYQAHCIDVPVCHARLLLDALPANAGVEMQRRQWAALMSQLCNQHHSASEIDALAAALLRVHANDEQLVQASFDNAWEDVTFAACNQERAPFAPNTREQVRAARAFDNYIVPALRRAASTHCPTTPSQAVVGPCTMSCALLPTRLFPCPLL